MKKAIRFMVVFMAIGGFFSVGFADPESHLGGGGAGGGITARP